MDDERLAEIEDGNTPQDGLCTYCEEYPDQFSGTIAELVAEVRRLQAALREERTDFREFADNHPCCGSRMVWDAP